MSAVTKLEARAVKTEHGRDDARLARKGRGRRIEQFHGKELRARRKRATAETETNSRRGRKLFRADQTIDPELFRSPIQMQLTALGPLPFLSGSTSNEIFCPSFSEASPGLLDRGDVDENIPPPIARLDEAITLVGIEELDSALLRHDAFPSGHGQIAGRGAPRQTTRGLQFQKMQSTRPVSRSADWWNVLLQAEHRRGFFPVNGYAFAKLPNCY